MILTKKCFMLWMLLLLLCSKFVPPNEPYIENYPILITNIVGEGVIKRNRSQEWSEEGDMNEGMIRGRADFQIQRK